MKELIEIQETVAIPSISISKVSKPTFFIDEENELYRATLKCYSADGIHVCTKEVFFTQEEYDAWGTDNTYIYNLIYTNLNIETI